MSIILLSTNLFKTQNFSNYRNVENLFTLPKSEVENEIVNKYGYVFLSKDVNSGIITFLKKSSQNNFTVNVLFSNDKLKSIGWDDTVKRGRYIVEDIGYDESYAIDNSKSNTYMGVFTSLSKDKGFQTTIFRTEQNLKKGLIAFSIQKVQKNPIKESSNEISSSYFNGTNIFCDENKDWKYVVSIKGDNITIVSYPGINNSYYKNKSKSLETINGMIKNGKIVTKDSSEYLTNRFSFENGILYETNNEGGLNKYIKCLK